MKNYKLVIVVSVIFTMMLFTSCTLLKSTTRTEESFETYKNETYMFTVEYPKAWKTTISEPIAGNEEHEGSPDAGITIYIQNDETESIYVFGQSGHINDEFPNSERRDFSTDSGVNGVLLVTEVEDRYEMYLVLDKGFLGAVLHLSKECYSKNETQIMRILKSIKSDL